MYDHIHESPPSPKPHYPTELPSLDPATPLSLEPPLLDTPVPASPNAAARRPLFPVTPVQGLPSTHQSLETNPAGRSDLDQTILGDTGGGNTAATTPKPLNRGLDTNQHTPTAANDVTASTTPINDPNTPNDGVKSPADDAKSPAEGLRGSSDDLKDPSDGEKTPDIETPSDIPSTPIGPTANADEIPKEDSGGDTPADIRSPSDQKPADSPDTKDAAHKDLGGNEGDAQATSKGPGSPEDPEAKNPDEEQATAQQHAGSNLDPVTQNSNMVPPIPDESAKPDDPPAPAPDAKQASGISADSKQDSSDLDAKLNASPAPPVNGADTARPTPKRRGSSRGRSDVQKALGTAFDKIENIFDSTQTRSQSPAGKSTTEIDDGKGLGDDDDFDDDTAAPFSPLDDPATPGKTKTEPITPTIPTGESKGQDTPAGGAPTSSIPPGDSSTGNAPPSGGPPAGDTNGDATPDKSPSDDAPNGDAAGQPRGDEPATSGEPTTPTPPAERPAAPPVDPFPPVPSDPAPATTSSTYPVDSSTTAPAESGTTTPADPITPAETGTPAEPTPEPTPRPSGDHNDLPAFHATPAPSMTTEATPRIPPIPPVQESVPQTPSPSAPLTDSSK